MFSIQNKTVSSALNAPLFRILNMQTLERRLRWALERARIKPAELARRARISRGAVSLWMSGGTKSIKGENLSRAAAALAVSPHWLATGEGPRETKATEFHGMAEPSVEYSTQRREHAALISAWDNMPKDVQNSLRSLILTLAKKRT